MTEIVVIGEGTRRVDGALEGEHALVEPDALPAALGWKLRAEGLCRDETCVPVRDRASLFIGERLDLAAVATALGRATVTDAGARVVAVALPAEQRRQALDGLHAPSFTLPDLSGVEHTLDDWHGVKKLLIAFASW
ncbi:MAG TPA: hypothetical protein VIB48_24595 [Acidimicrobiia bacterium]|jgi:hypothetical protein